MWYDMLGVAGFPILPYGLSGADKLSGIKPTGRHREKILSAATVRTITKPGLHADGNNLYLKVDKSGAKRWVQRITIGGKRRDIGLGPVSLVSLADARELALEHRKIARSGGDPIATKRRSSAIPVFEIAAQKVYDLSFPTWRNGKHSQQWLNTFVSYVFPHFGSKRVDDITGEDVLNALTPIWNSRPATARRVKQRISYVFKWVNAQGWRTDNPAEMVTKALPKHDRSKVVHRKALPYVDVAAAIATVQGSDAGMATKLAFEFLVLTCARSAETREAVWSEIDIDKGVWVIPPTRMKTKRVHRVPLSSRVIAILKEATALKQEGSDLIFPGTKANRPLSDMTLSKLMKDLGIAAVPHGFRSSFRDWAGEMTNHPQQVCEFALAHVIKDRAEAAYARSDLFDKRKKLMDDWASYIRQT